MKKNFFFSTFFIASLSAYAASSFQSEQTVSGKIVGPYVAGGSESENGIKSFYIKMPSRKSFNDPESTCGKQVLSRLPLLVQGMQPYKGKNVKMTVKIGCIESRLGSYGIVNAHHIITLP